MNVRPVLVRAPFVLAMIAIMSACSPFASKGTMPPPGPNGHVDASSAPDFLAVAGRDGGIAGYAHKADVLGSGDVAFPVFGEDLRTVVGQMVPGRGFVPAGVDPASIPKVPVEAGMGEPSPEANGQVVLYLRNDASSEVWVAVRVDNQLGSGTGFFGQNTGAGCYAMPEGSRLVLLDRSPEEPGASVVREIYIRGREPDPPSLWLTIGKDGSVQQGMGAPDWWGPPQAC